MKPSKHKEIWRDIPEYEGYYQVSNMGRVRGLERLIGQKNGKNRKVFPKILNQWTNHKGYWEVTLCKNGVRKHFRVNRLVARVFLGLPNDSSLEVNHLDEHKENNSVSNLQAVSHLENVRYSQNLHKNDPNYRKRKKRRECQIGLTA